MCVYTQLYIIIIGQIIQLYMEYLYFIDSISFNLEANQTHKFHYLKTRPKLTAQNCTRVGKIYNSCWDWLGQVWVHSHWFCDWEYLDQFEFDGPILGKRNFIYLGALIPVVVRVCAEA